MISKNERNVPGRLWTLQEFGSLPKRQINGASARPFISSNNRKANRLIAATANIYSLIALFIIISWCEVREEFQSAGQHVLDVNNWPQPKTEKVFFVGAYIRDWQMILWVLMWTATSFGSIFTVIWCEKRIMENLGQNGNPISPATQRMHKEFHRALLAMAICPLLTTTGPVLYYEFTIAFQLCSGEMSSVMTIGTTCITLFNPLTTIMFLRCYRRVVFRFPACIKHCGLVKPQETTVTQSSAVAIHTTPTKNM